MIFKEQLQNLKYVTKKIWAALKTPIADPRKRHNLRVRRYYNRVRNDPLYKSHQLERKEYQRQYHWKNRDKLNARQRKYYQKHKDKRLRYQANYRLAHADDPDYKARHKQAVTKYYQKNKAKIIARNTKYYQANKKRI